MTPTAGSSLFFIPSNTNQSPIETQSQWATPENTMGNTRKRNGQHQAKQWATPTLFYTFVGPKIDVRQRNYTRS